MLRVALLLCGSLAWTSGALAQTVLTVAAYPAVDKIVLAAIPAWKKLHPTVDIKVVSREFADHHTAMTTALSTSFHLPDVMALEVGYLGRFAQGGGLEDRLRELARGAPPANKVMAWEFIRFMTLDRDRQLAAFKSQDAFAGEVIDTELDKVLDRGKDIATALADAERLLAKRARR